MVPAAPLRRAIPPAAVARGLARRARWRFHAPVLLHQVEGVFPFGGSFAHGAVGDAHGLPTGRLRGFEQVELLQTYPSSAASQLVRKGR